VTKVTQLVVKSPTQEIECKLTNYIKLTEDTITEGENVIIKNVFKSFCRLDTLLRIFGYHGEDCTSKATDHWRMLIRHSNNNWMKLAKYKIAAYIAFHYQQPLPASPITGIEDNPSYLIGGGAGRYMKKILNTEQRQEFLQSVKHWKSAWERPDKKMLDEAEKEFVKEMTAEQKYIEDPISISNENEERHPKVEYLVIRGTIEAQLKRTVKEIFDHLPKYSLDDRIRSFFPSTSANYINNRMESGAIGFILDHPDLLNGLRTPGGFLKYFRNKSEEQTEKILEGNQHTEINEESEEFKTVFGQLWFRMLKRAIKEPQMVEPKALAESLKIRLITKGPPMTQTVLKNLQVFLHTTLRHLGTFQLLGKPQSEEVVLNALGKNLKDDEYYLSGDYQAATNDLKSWVSLAVAEQISESIDLTWQERDLFINNLINHKFTDEGEIKSQTKGQLMGSITSFPVLCIANAALCRWALETSLNKPVLLRDCPMLINGDDVVIRGPQSLYKNWKIITTFAGLKESVGKTYFSREFLDINSTNFERTKEPFKIKIEKDGRIIERESFLKLTPYVNLGLMFGFVRSEGFNKGTNTQNGLKDLREIGDFEARAKELLRYSSKDIHTKIMRVFIDTFRQPMELSRLPWYIPQWLGGIGIPSGEWGSYSYIDRRICHRITLQWSERRPIKLKDNKTEWRVWKLAEARLPKPTFCNTKNIHTEEYAKMVGQMCINTLFDSNLSLSDIHQPDRGGDIFEKLNHNRKLWSNKGIYPEPLPEEGIEYEAQYPNYVITESPHHKTMWKSLKHIEDIVLD
jgi:hypothetical protein